MDLWLHLPDMIPCQTMKLRYEDGMTAFESTYRKVFAFPDYEKHIAPISPIPAPHRSAFGYT